MIQRSCGEIRHQKADILVCPVNVIGVMGAGVAKSFRDHHPDLYYYYKKVCREGTFHLGTLALCQPQGVSYQVLLMPTKNHFRDASDVQQVQSMIRCMAQQAQTQHWSSIAIPPVGCGLGGLDFTTQVEPTIIEYCEPLDTLVTIVEY